MDYPLVFAIHQHAPKEGPIILSIDYKETGWHRTEISLDEHSQIKEDLIGKMQFKHPENGLIYKLADARQYGRIMYGYFKKQAYL